MACRTACDCRNPTTWVPTTDENQCYSGCAESPCGYAILTKCSFGNTFTENRTSFLHPVTILWCECLFNGVYSARRACSGTAFDNSGGAYVRPSEYGSAQHEGECNDCCWTPEELARSGAVWRLSIGGPPAGGYPDPPTDPVFASLVFYTVACDGSGNVTETPVAAYVSYDEWNCLGRNTMIFHGCYDVPCNPLTKWLPKNLCVVPYGSNWTHPCGIDNPDICDCEDHGCPRFGLDITIECETPLSQTVIMSRVQGACDLPTSTVPGSDICDEITWPDVDCGVFYGFLDNTCDIADTQNFWFIAWCESGVWTLRTYCALIDDSVSPAVLESVTLIDTQVMTRINVCEEVFVEDGSIGDYLDEMFEPVVIEPDPDDEGCCAPCVLIPTTCCPDDDLPTTLALTITGAYAASVVLTWNAGTSRWEGTHTCGGCTLVYTLACTSGTTWTLTARVSAGICGGAACEANATGTATDCDPFLLTLGSTTGGACVCGAGAVTYTITL
jgi:hypothetical protein